MIETRKARKRPIEIQAIQLPPGDDTPEHMRDWDDAAQWVIDGGGKAICVASAGWQTVMYIDTLEGRMIGEPGDWIIQGIKGEFYPCKPDIFDATYEFTDRLFT